jgi:hypothetical protein
LPAVVNIVSGLVNVARTRCGNDLHPCRRRRDIDFKFDDSSLRASESRSRRRSASNPESNCEQS